MAINLTKNRIYANADSLTVVRPAGDPAGPAIFEFSRDSEICIWAMIDGVPTVVTYDWDADQFVPIDPQPV